MSILEQAVGPAVAQWHESAPLRWTIFEMLGKGTNAELKQFAFDLTPLLPGYSKEFLLALKQCWIDRRLQVKLETIRTEAFNVQMVLQASQSEFMRICTENNTTRPVFERVDSDLILGLGAIQHTVPRTYLTAFKSFHKRQGHNLALFQAGLYPGDFPTGGRVREGAEKLGKFGQLRKNVLASSLGRATLVHILNTTEAAYEAGELSLGVFAYCRLLLSRAARPESFRVLRLKDLQIDEIGGTKAYFLTITVPKARTAERPRVTVRLHHDVGIILERQRNSVAKRLGDLIHKRNATLKEDLKESLSFTIGDLPLFPAGPSSGRIFQKTRDRLGMVSRTEDLTTYYVTPLKKLTGVKINHLALRHTIGTQLAIAGCSASTIAAVLLHATHQTASVYVDLIFSGAIDELSDSLEPTFLAHFPVIRQFVSINDAIDPAKRVVSPSLDRKRRETTGECGRKQICQYAPIACYECSRFIPCYDVDHTINLNRVNEEIESARNGGLPRQADMKRYMHIANRIRVVLNICETKRDAIMAEKVAAEIAP